MNWPPYVMLEGQHAVLIPTTSDHAAALGEAVKDGELWKLWYAAVPSPGDMAANIEARLAKRAAGSMLPFTVIDKASDEPVGMTTYMNIDADNRRLEIGSTCIAPASSARRSIRNVNTCCCVTPSRR